MMNEVDFSNLKKVEFSNDFIPKAEIAIERNGKTHKFSVTRFGLFARFFMTLASLVTSHYWIRTQVRGKDGHSYTTFIKTKDVAKKLKVADTKDSAGAALKTIARINFEGEFKINGEDQFIDKNIFYEYKNGGLKIGVPNESSQQEMLAIKTDAKGLHLDNKTYSTLFDLLYDNGKQQYAVYLRMVQKGKKIGNEENVSYQFGAVALSPDELFALAGELAQKDVLAGGKDRLLILDDQRVFQVKSTNYEGQIRFKVFELVNEKLIPLTNKEKK